MVDRPQRLPQCVCCVDKLFSFAFLYKRFFPFDKKFGATACDREGKSSNILNAGFLTVRLIGLVFDMHAVVYATIVALWISGSAQQMLSVKTRLRIRGFLYP